MPSRLSQPKRRAPHVSRLLRDVGILTFLFLSISPAPAQSTLRPPTPSEKKALDQFTSVVHPFLDTFDSDDWDTASDYDIDENVQVSKDPDVPLDVDELIQRTYTVKNNSPLYQREVAPYIAKMQQMSPAEMMQAGKKLKKLRLEVQIHFNRAAADEQSRTRPQLQIPGAAYSFLSEESDDKRSQTVILLFGDWKSAAPAENGVHFHFKHPPHTAAIENLEVQLQGSPDRIHELLKAADWKRLNDALTGTK